ncbi:hypothetical protein MRB53_033261 [Persea americana]|uniref:Uncharacterized protein n=1 Tax=Persea americana TaxID=3435 RepID=A0ACC2KTZ2_PERAE|nr:hypothetical protein MRB53_033261 [Persea americana]
MVMASLCSQIYLVSSVSGLLASSTPSIGLKIHLGSFGKRDFAPGFDCCNREEELEPAERRLRVAVDVREVQATKSRLA